jgi:ABC-2 type transport system permease protein
VFSASLYIITCSARNLLRVRLRRLREPRYLLGAIAGGAYLYFSFFGRFRAQRASAARRRTRNLPASSAALAALRASGPALAGLAFMVMTACAWILPFESGLLDFSKAEVQFLFPAPVSRRSLLLHRMLRSQIGMLFGSLIVGIAAPSLSGYTRLRISIGTWLLMCTSKVYFTGVSLARARLGSGNARVRRVAWLPLAVMTAAIAIVAVPLTRAFLAAPVDGVRDGLTRIGTVASHGAPRIVMAPFMAVAWPLFAAWPQPYLIALVASAAVLAAVVVWVLAIDETFQEAASEVAERKSRQPAAARASYRVRGSGWRLAPTGRMEVAFVWKAVMQTLRVVDKRTAARLAVIMIAMSVAAPAAGRASGLAATLGAFSIAVALFAILIGPQAMRIDLRQDLQHLELLKTWPLASSAVVRGEMIWPGLLLTAIAWAMTLMATVLSAANFSRVAIGVRLAICVATMVVAPALVFAQLLIHNGVALMFPAWVPAGGQRPRGLDAMGQRLILLGGTWLLLVVMALPGVIAGGIVWLVFRGFVGPAAIVLGAAVASGIVATEVLVGTEALGPAYERLDILAVERAE